MKSIDEAIQECIIIAEHHEKSACHMKKKYRDAVAYDHHIRYAEDQRQLAEWLKELKKYKKVVKRGKTGDKTCVGYKTNNIVS